MALLDCRPPPLSLTLYAGDDTTITLTVLDQQHQPVDLTGELVAQVRKKPADETVVCEPAVANPDGPSGVIWITFTLADTNALLADGGYHHWDIQHDGPDGTETIATGIVRTEHDITRP